MREDEFEDLLAEELRVQGRAEPRAGLERRVMAAVYGAEGSAARGRGWPWWGWAGGIAAAGVMAISWVHGGQPEASRGVRPVIPAMEAAAPRLESLPEMVQARPRLGAGEKGSGLRWRPRRGRPRDAQEQEPRPNEAQLMIPPLTLSALSIAPLETN